MQLGRFLSFFIGVFFIGLLQLWILFMVLLAIGHPIRISEILGDGGLFFFSTSLLTNSMLSLADFKPIKFGSKEFIVTLLALLGVILPVIVYYTAILSNGGLSEPRPFGDIVPLQIGCLLGAVVYWFFSGIIVGIFVKKEYDVA